MSTDPRVWVTAILTLAVYTFLIKDNRAFRLSEKFLVGLGAGYFAALSVKNVIQVGITPLSRGNMLVLLPLGLGLLVYTRYFKSVSWLSKIPIAFIVGLGAALTLRGTVQAQLIDQVIGTLLPWNSINNLIIVLGSGATVAYFHFGARGEGPLSRVAMISATFARIVMMAAFGIGFMGNLGSNIPRTIGQIDLLFGKWIKLIPGL